MVSKIKLFISFFIVLLSFVSLYSKATTCPPVDSINRMKSEYRWVTTVPGWTGYFVVPTSKGHSYKIDKFISATWVKSNDTPDSPGFIQCDYSGDFVTLKQVPNPEYSNDPVNQSKFTEIAMNEVIRFTQSKASSAKISDNYTKNWTCNSVIKFPNAACTCFTDIDKCSFRLT